jgi:hypothetical protein
LQSHRKKSNGFKTGGRACEATDPFLPIHLPSKFSLTIPVSVSRNLEVLHHAVATFFLLFLEAYPLNREATHFPENFSNTHLLNVPRQHVTWGYWQTLHTTRYWKWHCVTWCVDYPVPKSENFLCS